MRRWRGGLWVKWQSKLLSGWAVPVAGMRRGGWAALTDLRTLVGWQAADKLRQCLFKYIWRWQQGLSRSGPEGDRAETRGQQSVCVSSSKALTLERLRNGALLTWGWFFFLNIFLCFLTNYFPPVTTLLVHLFLIGAFKYRKLMLLWFNVMVLLWQYRKLGVWLKMISTDRPSRCEKYGCNTMHYTEVTWDVVRRPCLWIWKID